MAEFCRRCKMLAKQKYWDEFPPERHHFFKIMLGDFRHELRIPRKFLTNFKVELLGGCSLRGPSGNTWIVDLAAKADVMVFENGWDCFVRDHSLEESDFLVFSYAGNSSFNVLIFDASGCEKEACFFVAKDKSSCSGNDCIIQDKGKKVAEENKGKDAQDASEAVIDGELKYRFYYVSNRRPVTAEEKQRPYLLALDHSRGVSLPSVIITMLPTHVYKGFTLTIPKDWAIEHIPRDTRQAEVRVQPGGRKWMLGCRWTPSQCQIRSKWQFFVLENNLEEDDVCFFELLPKGKGNRDTSILKFNVLIFRVVSDVVPLTNVRMPQL